jgi:hypothetical protein
MGKHRPSVVEQGPVDGYPGAGGWVPEGRWMGIRGPVPHAKPHPPAPSPPGGEGGEDVGHAGRGTRDRISPSPPAERGPGGEVSRVRVPRVVPRKKRKTIFLKNTLQPSLRNEGNEAQHPAPRVVFVSFQETTEVMTTATSHPKPSQLVMDTDLLTGIQKNQSTMPTFRISGKNVTPAAALVILQSRVDAGNAFVVARGGYLQAAQANRDLITQTKVDVADYKAAVQLAYKDDPATLAQFGLVPHKKAAPKTITTKVVAVAKGASTRAQRHTMGPRAKAKVKGTVPATVTIDVLGGTAAASPVALAPPAPATPQPK